MHIEVMEKGKQKLMPNEYITVIRPINYKSMNKTKRSYLKEENKCRPEAHRIGIITSLN